MVIIGIDLGTTYTCAAIWRDGRVDVIPNDQGNRTTPSYVAFTPTHRLIGEPAKNQAPFNPGNTILNVKRLIGRRFDDPGVQEDLRHWPYKVINIDGKPNIVVEYKRRQTVFSPEEISAMVLCRMKASAEAYLDTSVTGAVITVPAYFTDAQRQATRTAGLVAGLDVLRIVNEPTAAALVFGIGNTSQEDRNVVVYDLGGGTFDVSIVTIADGTVHEVKSTCGVTRLGGNDIDSRLVDYFAEDFKEKYKKVLRSPKALRRLRNAAEQAKIILSTASEAAITVDHLEYGIDYRGSISRALFDELCSDLFKATIPPLERVLQDAKMKKSDINDIFLAGGSTRIPKIRDMIRNFFEGRVLRTALNPDEVVASGAAIQAAIINGDSHQTIRDLHLIDVTPLSLGIETCRGIMSKIIKRNTKIPCCHTKEVSTLEDNQNAIAIEVFEGERELTKDNNLLGTFNLYGIPLAPRGVPKIDVTFMIDANGILSVSAKDKCTGNYECIIVNNSNRLNQKHIDKMIADARRFHEEDVENRKRLEAKDQLEAFIYKIKQIVREHEDLLFEEEVTVMNLESDDALEWIDENKECMREEYVVKQTELMNTWSGIINKLINTSWLHGDGIKKFKSDISNIDKL